MVQIYEDVKTFYQETRDLLIQKEAVSQLIIANARGNLEHYCTPQKFFGRCLNEQGETMLIFCNVHPFNLCIYSVNQQKEDGYAQELAQYLITHELPIKGVNAKESICQPFLDSYKKMTHKKASLNLAMDIMEIRKLNPITLAKGFTRKAESKETSLLVEWELLFAKEALNKDLTIAQTCEKVKRKIEMGIIYLYFNEENEPVSVLNMARKLETGVVFNEVYTPVAHRGKAYAQSNVALATQKYLNEGNQFCALFVDKKNPISNRVYEKVGYQKIESCYDYTLL